MHAAWLLRYTGEGNSSGMGWGGVNAYLIEYGLSKVQLFPQMENCECTMTMIMASVTARGDLIYI